MLFRGQPLTPLGAAPDAGNNASLLLTKVLNSVKRKSLILVTNPVRKPLIGTPLTGCVCVCVSIYRPAAHMLMTCVLETPKEYRTPGGVSPWASKLYKNPIAREKSSFVCVFANSYISTVLQPRSGGLSRKILFTAYSCSWSPFL